MAIITNKNVLWNWSLDSISKQAISKPTLKFAQYRIILTSKLMRPKFVDVRLKIINFCFRGKKTLLRRDKKNVANDDGEGDARAERWNIVDSCRCVFVVVVVVDISPNRFNFYWIIPRFMFRHLLGTIYISLSVSTNINYNI